MLSSPNNCMLKKGLSIIILAILALNFGGYRLLSYGLEQAAEQNLTSQIEATVYAAQDLVHIKIPFSTPYGRNDQAFEQAEGKMEVKGMTYHYVKRRFYQDTLELYCLPNIEKASIQNARDQFFQLANDFESSATGAKAKTPLQHTVKFSVSDFADDHCFSWQFNGLALLPAHGKANTEALHNGFLRLPEWPPAV